MSLIRQIETVILDSNQGGVAQFYTPQKSNETMLVQIPGHAIDDLFVHRYQTDQLLVVRGQFVMVLLSNRRYQYIALSEDRPLLLRIPPGIPHGAINFSDQPCTMVNAVLRHGPPHPRDYQPITPPLPFDIDQARQTLNALGLTHV